VQPTEAAVRAELQAILASPVFANANRSRRFLDFTVQQALAAAQDSIKESVIGVEVFDRPDFDPRADPIVRVEAGKLRTRLTEYYGSAGKNSSVIIDMPKGAYVPRFSLGEEIPFAAAPAKPRKWLISAAIGILVLAGISWSFRTRSSPAPEIPAIAVLPFLNLTADIANEYFSDGLADQLTDSLAQIDGLHVASRTSAFTFRGKTVDSIEIGRKLHVSAILEGSVQKSGERVRITLQLIQTRDGYHLWSQTFDRELKDVFSLQDEISRAVARVLKITLADDVSRKLSRRYTGDAEAFDLYLRGRHALFALQPGSAGQAILLFQHAIDRDPQFALAYTGIAAAATQAIFAEEIPPAKIRQQVRSAAEKALQLDDSLAEAHAILASVDAQFDWNWTKAEQGFQRAIQLDPRSAQAHIGYAQNVLLPLRRFDQALAECRIAQDLDPLDAQMAYCTPWVHLFQNPQLALTEFQKLQADWPDKFVFAGGAIIAAIHAGHEAEVISTLEFQGDLSHLPPVQFGFLGYTYGRLGRTSDALKIEARLKHAANTQYVSPSALCLLYLGMGRLAESRSAAARAIQEHAGSVYTLPLDPLFAPLRTDPEFAALLKTVGLPF